LNRDPVSLLSATATDPSTDHRTLTARAGCLTCEHFLGIVAPTAWPCAQTDHPQVGGRPDLGSAHGMRAAGLDDD